MNHPAFIEVDAEPRYWEDATVNGVCDEEGTLIPLREGDVWKPVIELATGRVVGWPEGTTAEIHYKVCDQGSYWLQDADGNRLLRYESCYVPSRPLCPKKNGYGDYIIMDVGPDGIIKDWKNNVDLEEWTEDMED